MSTRLLIIDDQPSARELIRSYLTLPGMVFRECDSGQEAVACAREFKPHWVTVDAKMPDQSGFETIKALKEAYPEARAIIVTSFNEPQLRDLAHSAGAVGFILKENLLALRLLLERESKETNGALRNSDAPDRSVKPDPKRILVLDDDNETYGMLGLLADQGYQTTRAASGPEALTLHRQQAFDLVMIELLLADYNGFEAFTKLRREPYPPKFIVTAKSEWATADICLKIAKQLGAHQILSKPFAFEQLQAAIEKALK